MKPLTVEQLKALEIGDFVYSTNADKQYGIYTQKISTSNDEKFAYETIETIDDFQYSDYGKMWLAWKNKEQAEGDSYEDRYYALKAAIAEVCDKLSKRAYNEEFYRITLGSKLQCIEAIEEARLAELKGEK